MLLPDPRSENGKTSDRGSRFAIVGMAGRFPGASTNLNYAGGRVSHVLGLMGPAKAVDAACAPSLVAAERVAAAAS